MARHFLDLRRATPGMERLRDPMFPRFTPSRTQGRSSRCLRTAAYRGRDDFPLLAGALVLRPSPPSVLGPKIADQIRRVGKLSKSGTETKC